jgi:hypothetical protein
MSAVFAGIIPCDVKYSENMNTATDIVTVGLRVPLRTLKEVPRQQLP